MILIDPPSGWKYGFPKPFDNPDNKTTEEWLVENGYPEKEFNSEGKAHWVRWIETGGPLKGVEETIIKRGIKIG